MEIYFSEPKMTKTQNRIDEKLKLIFSLVVLESVHEFVYKNKTKHKKTFYILFKNIKR